MRILEVRDGFIKFESEQKLALSSFVLVNDALKSYIAQVIQVKRAGENSILYAKILYLYNGKLIDYDKSLPSIDAEISEFNIENINKNIDIKEPVVIGNFVDSEEKISIDKNYLNKKTLISIDSYDMSKTIITNLSSQFKNSLIIDTVGIFENNKFVAGVDFKLPLNTDALEFMFEDCLNDATSDSKNLIKEIFQDLADYSKTVPFLPFGALKTIVDEMVEKSHVFKLLVLKNKLAKFDKLGYFAATYNEAENLNNILKSKNAVIDLSKLDATFQNRYLSIILASIEKLGLNNQVFIEASNSLNKKTLKKLLIGNVSVTFATHSRFKYLNEIKSMFSNFLIEPTFANNEIFKTYAIFLKSMQKNSYLLVGEGTNYIPLISLAIDKLSEPETEIINLEEELNNTDALSSEQIEEQDSSVKAIEENSNNLIEKVSEEVAGESSPVGLNLFEEESDEIENLENKTIEEDKDSINELGTSNRLEEEEEEILENISEDITTINNEENFIDEFHTPLNKDSEFHTRIDEIQTVEIPEDFSEIADDLEISQVEETLIEESVDSIEDISNITEENSDTVTEETSIEKNLEVITLETNSESEEFGEIIELDDTEFAEDAIVVELDEIDNDRLEGEALDKAIVEDVDKVFTTIKEEQISDSDLDFIDELNGNIEEGTEEIVLTDGMEELTDFTELEESESELLEPIEEIHEYVEDIAEEKDVLETRSASTPIVPVYNADIPQEDLVTSDPIEQGDIVVHAKYGNGVVEKMIKYGTKTLYSINFDNVGRRLLDPTLTEIKKS